MKWLKRPWRCKWGGHEWDWPPRVLITSNIGRCPHCGAKRLNSLFGAFTFHPKD